METLVTGYIDIVSQSFLTHMSMKSDIIVSSERELLTVPGRNITTYHQSVLSDDFLNLFSSYSFDAVIFFLNAPENNEPDIYEMEKLERVLEICAKRSIKKLVVVSSAHVYKGNGKTTEEMLFTSSNGADVRLFSLEDLCRTYIDTYNVPVTILRTACLYGEEETESYVGRHLKQLIDKDTLVLEGKPDQRVGFLSLTDLGRLIERILIEPQKSFPVMNVSGGSVLSLRQFADLLQRKKETISIQFTEEELAAGPPIDSIIASNEYYWEPTIKLHEELESMLERIENKYQLKTKTLWERTREFIQTHSLILAIVELAVGFLLMEYLVDMSQATVQFRMIDYRLLFVVLFAGTHGPQIGLLAALLASFSTYSSFAASGVDWRIIFYNVENWIPFAAYFIVAWIIGYIHDRYKMDLADAKEEVEVLSNRYALLNDLYLRSLERKSLYEKQIISYKDSFGKIYQLTLRLDSAESSLYFNEALEAVEEMLDNETISFYVYKKDYAKAYRYICSSKAFDKSPEQLDLNEYGEFNEILTDDDVWTNKNQLDNYPDFAIRLYSSNDFTVLFTIEEARFDQMSLYYENLIKVSSHFVSTSLAHKMYTEQETLTELLSEFLEETIDGDDYMRHSKAEKSDSEKPGQLHVVHSQRNHWKD